MKISAKRIHRNLFILGLALVALLVFSETLSELSLATISNIGSVSVLVVLAMVIRTSPYKLWAASSIYIIVFSLFHFGLTFVYGLGAPIDADTEGYMLRWFYAPQTNQAIVISIIGIIACGFGVHLALSSRTDLTQQSSSDRDAYLSKSFVWVGFLILLLSICGWFILLISTGGMNLLIGSYSVLLDATKGLPLPYLYYGIGLGMTFLAATPSTRLRSAGFLIFLVWTAFAFPLGLRNEVLVPACGTLVVAARRRSPLSAKKAFILGICLLSAISFIKDFRQYGFKDFTFSNVNVTPSGALTEMGGSLRPVSEVILWHGSGDDFIYGASYVAPFDRALGSVLPGSVWDRVPAEDDERLMNVLVQKRAGPIGFSPVAEAFRNFGAGGVCVIMFLTGLLLGWLDTWPVTQIRQVALGVVLLPLLLQVRNAFTPVPFQMILGFTLLYVALGVMRSLRRGREARARPLMFRRPLRSHL